MKNYHKTMDNCRAFIQGKSNAVERFKNQECSSFTGFEYILKNGMVVKLRVDESIQYLIMEVYPGITVLRGYQSMLAEYCQKATPLPGVAYLALSDEHCSIYCHVDSCFRDNPTSLKLLQKMEDMALDMLAEHIPVIENLACGKLPDGRFGTMDTHQASGADWPVLDTGEQDLLDQNEAVLQAALKDLGHNVVAQNLNPNSNIRFFIETLTNDMRYHEFLYICQGGWFVRTIRLDMKCGEAFRTQLAQFCNRITDTKKVGFLKIGDDGYPYCMMSTYLLDGQNAVSQQTLDELGANAIAILENNKQQLICIGHGVLPPQKLDTEFPYTLAQRFASQMSGKSPSLHGRMKPTSLLDLLDSVSAGQKGSGDEEDGQNFDMDLDEYLDEEFDSLHIPHLSPEIGDMDSLQDLLNLFPAGDNGKSETDDDNMTA